MSPGEHYYLELLKKLLDDTISSEERDALALWADTDAKKKQMFQYFDGRDNEKRLEAEIIYEKTKPNDLCETQYLKKNRFTVRKTRYLSVAVCVICLVVAFLFVREKLYLPLEQQNEWLEMKTAKGERKFFRMNDDTEIWLNSESVLKVKKGFGKEHRIVMLTGEGYFSVAKNETLPLYVNALNTEIKVLGTVFNVKAYPDEERIATSLMEGKIELHVENGNKKNDYTLNPGDKVEVPNKQFDKKAATMHPAKKEEGDIEELADYKKIAIEKDSPLETMWIENKLVFSGDSLREAVKKMERWYNKTIVIQNEDLNGQFFTGVFQERSCEQVLDLLQKTGVKFSYNVDNGIIYIK